jgi:hypothetical protein
MIGLISKSTLTILRGINHSRSVLSGNLRSLRFTEERKRDEDCLTRFRNNTHESLKDDDLLPRTREAVCS